MKLAIIVPVYNDWKSCNRVIRSIDSHVPALGASVTIIAVDDGSIAANSWHDTQPPTHIGELGVLGLACIAIWLAHVNCLKAHDAMVIMDSDGEDRPAEIGTLSKRAAQIRVPLL